MESYTSMGRFSPDVEEWSSYTKWLGHCLLPMTYVDIEGKEYNNTSDSGSSGPSNYGPSSLVARPSHFV